MNFLNSLPLWGGLAAAGIAVPIIIHLLHQRHRRRTDWAAMELLRRALVIRSGQVRLEDLLLLLLRCLVLALVAFALLRPVLDNKTAGFMGGERRVGMIVAIDASYSMGHGKLEKRMTVAMSRVQEILSTAQVGDSVTVVLLGDKPRTLFRGANYEEGRFKTELDKIKVLPEKLNLERSLDEVAKLVGELKGSVLECYFVTDAQAIDWNKLSEEAKVSLKGISDQASLYITPIKVTGEENLAVTNFGYASGSFGPNGTARFLAEVKNFGRHSNEAGTATLTLNKQTISRQSIGSIEAGKTKMLSFFTTMDEAGDAKLSVSLSDDSLQEDNQRHTVVGIKERIRILCIDGEPASSEGPSEIFWLLKALKLKQVEEDSTLDVVRADWQDLDVEKFTDYDLIALANVPSIGTNASERLDSFVKAGGGLVVFAGERIDTENYNNQLHGTEVNLLPGELKEVTAFLDETLENEQEERDNSWTIGMIQSDHVLAKLAAKIPEEARSYARVQRVIKVNPDPKASTILSLSESDLPLLIEKKVGLGTVLLFTTTADRAWSNLAIHPLFPMMIQQATTHLTSRPGERNTLVGELVQVPLTGQQAGSNVMLRSPNDEPSSVTLTVLNSGVVACPVATKAPGFYDAEAENAPVVSMAVNIDSREADARVISADSLKGALEGTDANVIPPEGNLAILVKDGRKGMEISITLLMLALAIFILQGYLAKRFTNRMTGAGAANLEESLRKHTVAAARRT